VQFDRYANMAAENAAALVNLHRDHAPGLAEVRDLLADRDLAFELTAADLPALVELAEELGGLFAAVDLEEAVDRLNQQLAGTAVAPRISMHDGRDPHLHVEPDGAGPVLRLRANCLMGLAAVLCDGGRLRIGTCAADDCDLVWLDTSRNARRRFCSDRCATRTHVAAHRARRRGGPSA
jgi:predicted RNA-binding Zn ribbon-like protein